MPAPEQFGRIEIISDVICPWCYIGKRHMERALEILAEDGLRLSVSWLPFQLNPDMPAEGVDRRDYRIAKFGSWEKSQQLDARITETGAAAGLAFHLDRQRRTPNTVAAHRVIRMAGEHGVQNAVVEALFAAYFTQGADLGDPAVLDSLAAAAGLPGVADMLAGDAGREEVLAQDSMARNAGINGVPSFVMNRHVLFSGAMPAETMAEAFTQAWKILGSKAA